MSPNTYESKLGTLIVEVPSSVQVHPEWKGWRFTQAGQYLVTPDGQHINKQRMLGLLWRDEMELRRAGFASRRKANAEKHKNQLVKVVVIKLADYLDGQKVSAA